MENKPFFSGLCYCIKNFNNYRLDDDKFTPDKYYKTTYESNNTIFVIYNEYGGIDSRGFRFYLGESPDYNNFFDYFQIVNRAFKLKKLKNIEQ
jgi:hypothetical protein